MERPPYSHTVPCVVAAGPDSRRRIACVIVAPGSMTPSLPFPRPRGVRPAALFAVLVTLQAGHTAVQAGSWRCDCSCVIDHGGPIGEVISTHYSELIAGRGCTREGQSCNSGCNTYCQMSFGDGGASHDEGTSHGNAGCECT